MVTEDGAKVVDFGIAATVGPVDPDAELLGTPAYLAPERLTGDGVEPASDVYALGVLMYRLLAGESPWSVDSTTQMLTAHVYIELAPLPQLDGVPPAVTGLVNRMLCKEAAGRPTAADAAAILSWAAEDEEPSVDATVLAPEGVPAPPPGRSRRSLILGGVTAAVVAVAVAGVLPSIGERDDAGAPPAGLPSIPARSATGAPSAGPTVTARPVVAPEQNPDPSVVPSAVVSAVVSAVASGDPSPSAEPVPSAGPESPVPIAGVRTFTSPGGTVEASCDTSGQARLIAWAPKDPYQVERVSAGPALTAAIVFRYVASRIRMTVTCVAGSPTAVTLPI
nr:hypothetical protein GCM10020092_014950 [Actinoplanes digitatis]